MLTVYTANSELACKGLHAVNVTYEFPENEKSPWEQIEWMDHLIDHMKRRGDKFDESILTYSPYILNYLNLLIKRGDLNYDNLNVQERFWDKDLCEFHTFDLKIVNDGVKLIDTTILSEPIAWIYDEYNKLDNNEKNK